MSKYLYVAPYYEQKVHQVQKADLLAVALGPGYGGVIFALIEDATYLYYGGNTTNKVTRLLKSDMSTKLDSADFGTTISALSQDSTYIYVAGTASAIIRKIRKSDMATITDSASTGGGTSALLASADGYVYVSILGGASAGKVRKIRASDMATIADSAVYHANGVMCMTDFVGSLYVGGYTAGIVRQIRKSDMATVADSAFLGGGAWCNLFAMTSDPDGYIYTGGWDSTGVGVVFKLRTSPDLSLVKTSAPYGTGSITAILNEDSPAVTYPGYDSCIYVGGTGLNQVRRIRKSDMSLIVDGATIGEEITALSSADTAPPVATKDNYIYSGGIPGANFLLLDDEAAAPPKRTILEFILPIVPANTMITRARVGLYCYAVDTSGGRVYPTSKQVRVARLTRADWVDGEATWLVYKSGSNWTTPGGDFTGGDLTGLPVFTPSASVNTWFWFNATSAVQAAYAAPGAPPRVELMVKFEDESLAAACSHIWFDATDGFYYSPPLLEVSYAFISQVPLGAWKGNKL